MVDKTLIKQAVQTVNAMPPLESPYDVPKNPNVHTLYYGCSGSDVRAPLALCPNATTIIMMDEHPLFDRDEEKNEVANSVSDLFNAQFYNQIEEMVGEDCVASFGNLGPSPTGYDYTNVYGILNYRSDLPLPKPNQQLGSSHLLLGRLRRCCGAEIIDIKPIENNPVYEITIWHDGLVKTIYYVQSYLHNADDPGLAWVTNQQFNYDGMLIKGFPYARNTTDEKSYMRGLGASRNMLKTVQHCALNPNFTLITDTPMVGDQNQLPLNLHANPDWIHHVEFGYGRECRQYSGRALDFQGYNLQPTPAPSASASSSATTGAPTRGFVGGQGSGNTNNNAQKSGQKPDSSKF